MAFPMERKDLSLDDGCWGATSKFGTVTNPCAVGIASGSARVPTEMLDTFASRGGDGAGCERSLRDHR